MRTLHSPAGKGPGVGRVVYFLWGHGGDPAQGVAAVEAEVRALTGEGYSVVVDTAPGQRNLREALYSQDPEFEGHETVALCWSGEGGLDGSLQLSTREWVSPQAIEPAFVTHELEWVAFARCHTGKHRAIWQARLGQHMTVLAEREAEAPARSLIAELIHATLLPDGAGVASVTSGDEAWEDAEFDGGEVVVVSNPDEDTYWEELFALLAPQRARAIEEQLGLSTRQYVWRLGELLSSAVIHQLQGNTAKAAESHELAAAAASLLTGAIPTLFEGSGDPALALEYLRETVPHSALGRGARRFGADHGALFDISLHLLMLALSAEASDPIRERLRALGSVTKLAPDIWESVLALSGKDLFNKAHQQVFDALAGERQPSHTTRALVFGIGRRLAIAAGMDTEDDPEGVQMLVSCRDMATVLKVDLPRRLERQGRFPDLAKQIARKHGPDHASLFKLATQLIALRDSYDPMNPETTYRIMKRLTRARKKASLPKALFKPLSRVKQSTANRSKGSRLIDQTLQGISEHLLLELA